MRTWLLSLLGLPLFLWPFLGGDVVPDAPAWALALGAVLALALVELGARRLDTRRLALLAALAAIDAALRLAIVNGIGGFSPVFFLILCAGWVFGPSYGFLAGAFALLVSALATGGIGPWLPYEMVGAGWVGVAAGLAAWAVGDRPGWRALAALALVGVATGFVYGALLDVQGWVTGFRGSPDLGWTPGMPPLEALTHFARFYVVTSLGWDAFRAVGNALMIVVLGMPILAALRRLRARFTVEIVAPPV